MKNRFYSLVGLSVLFVALMTFGGCQQPVADQSDENEKVESTEEDEKSEEDLSGYSKDQQKVVDNFGQPDEFMISFHVEEEPRLETWKYIEIGQVFVFEDGVYKEAHGVDFGVPENQVFLKAKIDPKDVYELTSIKDLEKLLETDATSYLDVDESIWEDAVFYDFAGVVSAATIEDELVFVKTQSHVSPYTWDELIEGMEEMKGDDGLAVEAGEGDGAIEFDEDYGFKLVLPAGWEDFEVVEEEMEESEIYLVSFMLPTEDTEYVADGWLSMFTITAYYHGNADDVSPFEEVIGKNNEFLYTFSHMNGFPPDDLQDQARDFEAIRESITLYDL